MAVMAWISTLRFEEILLLLKLFKYLICESCDLLYFSGVILVTTPHEAALQVCGRGALMFTKLRVPIIGIVQNMSRVICNKCNTNLNIFGSGTESLAMQLGLEMLEDIPLDAAVAQGSDTGRPVLVTAPDSQQAESYKNLARKVIAFNDRWSRWAWENVLPPWIC